MCASTISIVGDPNSKYVHPEFCPSLDSDHIGLRYQFWKELKVVLESEKKSFLKLFKKIMASEEFFFIFESLKGKYVSSILHLLPLAPLVTCGGSNLVLGPQLWC